MKQKRKIAEQDLQAYEPLKSESVNLRDDTAQPLSCDRTNSLISRSKARGCEVMRMNVFASHFRVRIVARAKAYKAAILAFLLLSTAPAIAQEAAVDDESLNNTPGDVVTVFPLANDIFDLSSGLLVFYVYRYDEARTTVIDYASYISFDTPFPFPSSFAVPGEGTWLVVPPSSGEAVEVTFTPAAGFTGDPTPVHYNFFTHDENGPVPFPDGLLGFESEFGSINTPAQSSLPTITITYISDSPEILAIDDGPTAVDGATGATIPNVVVNDSLDGTANPTIDTDVIVNVAGTAQDGTTTLGLHRTPATGGITLDPSNGDVTVASGTTAGAYVYTYEICEVGNTNNCDTAEISIVVNQTDLISEIEEDLIRILEEDLANTLMLQSRQISGYSADALNRLRGQRHDSCLSDVKAILGTENILFDTDRAIIKAESNRVLDKIAATLLSCTEAAFEIAGHTDSDASDAHNRDLSYRRALAVMKALAERGVDTSGFVARGYGESQPIASNATEAGKFFNRRVEFRILDGADNESSCEDRSDLVRNLNAHANGADVTADMKFLSDRHDCATGSREVYEGSFSYLDTGQSQTQIAFQFSYRREKYRGSESVFGYFAGLYGTQSNVSGLADGEISGVGLNAGLYGAKRVRHELFLDYYLGAAIGHHEFGLDFERDIGLIKSTGNYQYLAGFAGAALSGEIELGETTLTPRIGFDYMFTRGADVEVVAELGGVSQVGHLELDKVSGSRTFAEIRADYPVDDGKSILSVSPRVSCYQSLSSLDADCGFGGTIGFESVEHYNGLTYAFEIDGEWGEGYESSSISMSVERQIGSGVFGGRADFGSNDSVGLTGTYVVRF